MAPFNTIRDILMELLDVPQEDIRPEHYLVQDLGVESIDFLELAVNLNERFSIPVEDDDVFLFNLRDVLESAGRTTEEQLSALEKAFPFLSKNRPAEILKDLDSGPVLKVTDLVQYVVWQLEKAPGPV